MQIQIAEIVAGSETPAGDGSTDAQRCVIQLTDGTKRSAVLKRGPIGEVTAEAFSALLLQAWGLPVPEPYLIIDGSEVSFASADVAYPNFKQRIGLNHLPDGPVKHAAIRVAAELICKLGTTPLATACDEAIDNRDRNLGNILWDGESEIWIDHAFALGQGHHMEDANKLCQIALLTGADEKIQRGAVASALMLARDTPSQVEVSLASEPLQSSDLAAFITNRLATIGNRIVARFPEPKDLLAGI